MGQLRKYLKMIMATTIRREILHGFKRTNRLFSTISITRIDQVQEQKDLIVDYLDGDKTGIVVLGLNRPAAKNAFSKNLVMELCDAVETVKFDKSVRVIIIKSTTPGIFCAGADLKERVKMPANLVGAFVAKARRLINDLENLPMPVIAAIDGHALGGGLEMALACDLRVASDTAKVGLTETKLAIIPGAGGTQRLPRIVGIPLAKELIFTAKMITGKEAAGIRLVNHSVPQNENGDAAFEKALEVDDQILPNGPVGVKMGKIAINKGVDADLNKALSIEELCYAQVIPTKDRLEALKAFKEKRAPNFTGE